MGNNYPTKNGVDAAEALTFPEIRRFTIAATVQHRGRQLVVTSEGYTADEFCDLLDKRFGPAAPNPAREEHTARSATPPLCPRCNKPMKPMQHPDRRGNQFWCTQKIGDDYCAERA